MASCGDTGDEPPPLLNGAVDDDDDDDIAEDDFDYELDDDDDWEESEDLNVSCLFCDEAFGKMDEFHFHSKEKHEFQVKTFAKRLQLDSISFIKFVNYVRKNRISIEELNGVNLNFSQVCV